ncbi:DUF6300 family protein [Streptomyces lydicus]|uniref:DUF6300 family protein n=1 Tax=Streptomyces lydicus TaxID=47763 RepID=UPI0036E9E44B
MTADQTQPAPTQRKVNATLACPCCGEPGLLTALYPHNWHGRSGQVVSGYKEAVLCAVCDRGEEAAQDVIALVDTQGQIGPENTELFIRRAVTWVDSARGREPDYAVLADEELRWHSGEL